MNSLGNALESPLLSVVVTIIAASTVIVGLVAIFAVRRETTRTYREMIALRDQLLKLSIIAHLPIEERDRVFPILNDAFTKVDAEFSSTMRTLFGQGAAADLMYKLGDRTIAVEIPKEAFHG